VQRRPDRDQELWQRVGHRASEKIDYQTLCSAFPPFFGLAQHTT
jgi:hypothetical protein